MVVYLVTALKQLLIYFNFGTISSEIDKYKRDKIQSLLKIEINFMKVL